MNNQLAALNWSLLVNVLLLVFQQLSWSAALRQNKLPRIILMRFDARSVVHWRNFRNKSFPNEAKRFNLSLPVANVFGDVLIMRMISSKLSKVPRDLFHLLNLNLCEVIDENHRYDYSFCFVWRLDISWKLKVDWLELSEAKVGELLLFKIPRIIWLDLTRIAILWFSAWKVGRDGMKGKKNE